MVAGLPEGPVRCGAEDTLEVDRHDVAGGGIGPARLEELLARRDEIVRACPHPLGVEDDDARLVGQDVEDRLHAVDERRRQGLHALDGDALGDLEQHVGDAGQLLGEGGRPLPDRVGEQDLAAGRRPEHLGGLERALVGDLEPPDLVDRVPEELHAQRVLLGRREDVEDAAADGELPPSLHEVGADVGRGGERLGDLGQLPLVTDPQPDRLEVAEPLGDRLEDGADGGDDVAERTVAGTLLVGVGQAAQHREPAADGVAARAEPLVRQRLPAGEGRDELGVDELAERGGEVVRLTSGRGDDQPGRVARALATDGRDRRRPQPGGRDDVDLVARGAVSGDVRESGQAGDRAQERGE